MEIINRMWIHKKLNFKEKDMKMISDVIKMKRL